MGCDIHEHIEYKRYDTWWHWGRPTVRRDYNLFALLAGVRNYEQVEPVAEPRDIPKDSTYDTVMSYTGVNDYAMYKGVWVMDADWHTPSWLSLGELKQVRERLGYRSNDLEAIIGAMEGLSDNGAHDTRFIFWFDN